MKDSDYRALLDWAKTLLVKSRSDLQPEEVVNEAFLLNYQKPFELATFKKTMSTYVYAEKKLSDSKYSLDETFINTGRFKTDSKVCSYCNEVLPIGAFRLTRNDLGVEYSLGTCIPCERKKWHERPTSNLEEQRRLLTDHYIKKVLREKSRKRTTKAKDITPEMIMKERIYQLNKRGDSILNLIYTKKTVPFMERELAKARSIINSIRNQTP